MTQMLAQHPPKCLRTAPKKSEVAHIASNRDVPSVHSLSLFGIQEREHGAADEEVAVVHVPALAEGASTRPKTTTVSSRPFVSP